ncbi:hypothetical protein MKC48_20425 [[Clostridium] innocuum]|nr:hypothetical protein [[Clostridium] innocuum]
MRPFKKNTIIAIMHIAQADTVTLTAWSGIMISKTRLILRKKHRCSNDVYDQTDDYHHVCPMPDLLSLSIWIKCR